MRTTCAGCDEACEVYAYHQSTPRCRECTEDLIMTGDIEDVDLEDEDEEADG